MCIVQGFRNIMPVYSKFVCLLQQIGKM